MPDKFCRKCGQPILPEDIFCPNCGAALGIQATEPAPPQPGTVEQLPKVLETPKTVVEKGPVVKPPPQSGIVPLAPIRATTHTGVIERAPVKGPGKPRHTVRNLGISCAVVLLLAIIAAGILFALQFRIYPASAPKNNTGLGLEMVGTSTPYKTRTPFPTATNYPTPTRYPTAIPYPTTGRLDYQTGPLVYVPAFPLFGGCQLNVHNNFTDRDAVVMLADAFSNEIEIAVYVRARDTFSIRGLDTGTYYTYYALGQDWDAARKGFAHNATYFRKEVADIFDTCGSGILSSYQYLTIVLEFVSAGEGDPVIPLPGLGLPGGGVQ